MALVTAALSAPAVTAGSHATASRLGPADATLARVAGGQIRPVVLVIGDSLVEQAADALRAESNSGVEVRVTDRLGTAPCDWTGGDFNAALAAAHPSVVVLAFSEFKREKNAAADIEGVIEAFKTGRELCPFVVAEI